MDEKSPGVTGVPSASKKIRRGPSELYVSTDSVPSKTAARIRAIDRGHADRIL